MKSWILGIALAISCGSSMAAEPATADVRAPVPTESFFRHPDLGEVKLSPSGRFLAAAVRGKNDRVALGVIDLDKMVSPTVVASYTDADVRTFDWVNDERLVYSVVDLQLGNAEQSFGPSLVSVKRDGLEPRFLILARQNSRREHLVGLVQPLDVNHFLMSVPQTGGNDVIVGQVRFDNVGDPVAVYPLLLDITTGRTRSLAVGIPDHAMAWVFDAKGAPRVAVAEYQGQQEVFWRGEHSEQWQSLGKSSRLAPDITPVMVDANDRLFVTTGSDSGTSVLRRYDFSKGRVDPEPVVSAKGFDFQGGLIFDYGATRAFGVRVETDAETTVWFDEGLKKLQALADARFPGHVNRLTCRRCTSDGVMLVFSYSDQDPGSYWLYRAGSQTWEPAGKTRVDIDPARMSQVDFFRTKARDGEDLPIWVTTPNDGSKAPRPAVLLVHGGPWARGGHWHWNGEAQFLASRGYVVIEPEFRGSKGYGDPHFRSSFKEWGGKMQDDLTDAVEWASATGKADGKRVCIAGASYGGYAVLMSLVRYPDRYRCGVAWVAVTDPRLLFEASWSNDSTEETRRYSLPAMIGDPDKDIELLKAATPAEHADRIRVPVYLAFGSNDRRVPLEHGTRMRDVLHAAGNDAEWTVYLGEGHGWQRLDHNVDFHDHMARFLDRNLRSDAPIATEQRKP